MVPGIKYNIATRTVPAKYIVDTIKENAMHTNDMMKTIPLTSTDASAYV